MDKKVEKISKILGMPPEVVALSLYTYLSVVLEELLEKKSSVTMFGELILDEENNIQFKNNKFEFDNGLFSKKDMLSILQVVENGPAKPIFR